MVKFSAKKIVFIAMVAVIAISGIIWAIVANIQPNFKSGITDIPAVYAVSGNGSGAVMVDDYLYYVGDKVSTSSIEYHDNDYYYHGNIPAAGIYRVHIKDNKPEIDYEMEKYTDEDGNEQTYAVDDPNAVFKAVKSGVTAVVPKIAGHDQTAMWIYGNNLIYTSPNNLRNSVGALRTSYLDFFCVNLDGSNHRLIYTTTVSGLTTADFTVWSNAADSIYLLVKENTTIKKINVLTTQETIIAENASNVVFPIAYGKNKRQTWGDVYNGVMRYVYYTTTRNTDDDAQKYLKGNTMWRYQIDDNTATVIADDGTAEKGTTWTPLTATLLNDSSKQFIFKTSTVYGNESPIIYYHVVLDAYTDTIIKDVIESYALKNAGDDLGLTSSDNPQFYGYGLYLYNNNVYRYKVGSENGSESKIIKDTNPIMENIDSIVMVSHNIVVARAGALAMTYDLTNKSTNTISLVLTNGTTTTQEHDHDDEYEDEDLEEDSSTVTANLRLPLSLMIPCLATGDVSGEAMLFIADTTGIKIVSINENISAWLQIIEK